MFGLWSPIGREKLHDAEDLDVPFLVERLNVMLLPGLEALDLRAEAEDLAGEMRKHRVLRRETDSVDVHVGALRRDAVRDRAHHRLVAEVVGEPARRMKLRVRRDHLAEAHDAPSGRTFAVGNPPARNHARAFACTALSTCAQVSFDASSSATDSFFTSAARPCSSHRSRRPPRAPAQAGPRSPSVRRAKDIVEELDASPRDVRGHGGRILLISFCITTERPPAPVVRIATHFSPGHTVGKRLFVRDPVRAGSAVRYWPPRDEVDPDRRRRARHPFAV